MSTRLFSAAVGMLVLISMGCCGHNFFGPQGPLNRQQAAAVVHDPFPQGDIAPSDLGARPPSYQTPLPEPVRNRIVADAMPWLGR